MPLLQFAVHLLAKLAICCCYDSSVCLCPIIVCHNFDIADGIVCASCACLAADWSNAYFDANINSDAFQTNLASFIDQRSFLAKAVSALGNLSIVDDIQAELQVCMPVVYHRDLYTHTSLDIVYIEQTSTIACQRFGSDFRDGNGVLNCSEGEGPLWYHDSVNRTN